MAEGIRRVIAPLNIVQGKNYSKIIIESDLEIKEHTSSSLEYAQVFIDYGLIGTKFLFVYDDRRVMAMVPIDSPLSEKESRAMHEELEVIQKKVYGSNYISPGKEDLMKQIVSSDDILMQSCIEEHFDKKDSKERYTNLNHLLKKLSNMNNRSKAVYVLIYVGSHKSIEYEEFKALKHIRRGLKWLIKRKLIEETLAGSVSITDAGVEFVRENITRDQFELIRSEIDSIVAYEEFGQSQ